MENENGKPKIGLESDLKKLSKQIMKDRRSGKIKKGISSRVLGMLGYLSNDKYLYVPKKIDNIGGLYTLSEDDILQKFRNYKIKTWIGLNEILQIYNLPSLNLPQEYTPDPLNS